MNAHDTERCSWCREPGHNQLACPVLLRAKLDNRTRDFCACVGVLDVAVRRITQLEAELAAVKAASIPGRQAQDPALRELPEYQYAHTY